LLNGSDLVDGSIFFLSQAAYIPAAILILWELKKISGTGFEWLSLKP